MNFRTEFKLKPGQNQITYKHKLLFLGSCFAENIGKYFEYYRFDIQINPFGILYHPSAIKRVIDIALNADYDPYKSSFKHAELWSNFDAHSSLSSLYEKQLISNLNSAQQQTQKSIEYSDFIFITLGTAWVYKHLENNIIVNNCHKLPQKQFEKQLMTLSEVENTLSEIIQKIKHINPNVTVIFTLSPVRHLKDGFVENQRSKSTLHLGIQNVLENFKNTYYFPSYELLLDDLRDYRFYDKDQIHPNTVALDYIWSKLNTVFFSDQTQHLTEKIDAINKRMNHKLFNPESKDSLAFKRKTEDLIDKIKEERPYIRFK